MGRKGAARCAVCGRLLISWGSYCHPCQQIVESLRQHDPAPDRPDFVAAERARRELRIEVHAARVQTELARLGLNRRRRRRTHGGRG